MMHLIRLERKERPRRPPPQCWVAKLVRIGNQWRRQYAPRFRSLIHVNGRASFWRVELYFLVEENAVYEAYEHSDVFARKINQFFFVHNGQTMRRLSAREMKDRGLTYVGA